MQVQALEQATESGRSHAHLPVNDRVEVDAAFRTDACRAGIDRIALSSCR